ncbi:GIY-YIG nuclease family protein [Fundidesulfovibrio terrae]|uniref:GIY-YIG nuclease family protein n=1 Tax=Fundidesulfovibrio terrae TaxID=2922866 RepID=UPI001FAF1BBB|nr:GIY-YIG nuclease family protein [Fundidesulfovibrio terrae]
MTWYVYIVTCSDDTLYCGVTSDITRRLNEHNGMLPGGAKYTRTRRPIRLAVSIEVQSRSEACKIEWLVKRMPREKKIEHLSILELEYSSAIIY